MVSIATMIPLPFPDKRAAMLGAFCDRFLIGLFVATTTLPLPPIGAGALIGFLLSLPSAIITKAYIPIIGLGIVLGALVGWAIKVWG